MGDSYFCIALGLIVTFGAVGVHTPLLLRLDRHLRVDQTGKILGKCLECHATFLQQPLQQRLNFSDSPKLLVELYQPTLQLRSIAQATPLRQCLVDQRVPFAIQRL